MIFKTGDVVTIECDGRTVRGSVGFASSNGKSLMLNFDALLDGHLGAMPVLQNDDGAYRALLTGKEVILRPVQ